MSEVLVHSTALVGTVVTFEVRGHGRTDTERREREAGVARAVAWFHEVERACSRFDSESEVRRLALNVGVPVCVSELLLEAVRFALAVADQTGGAFDPAVGRRMESLGFNRHYRTGETSASSSGPADSGSWRDVEVDAAAGTITLRAPILLDLGAVAKGLAIDLAARELAPFANFAIDAGGDAYFGGVREEGSPWSVGIRHPRDASSLIETLRVTNAAVCTSGDYERIAPGAPDAHHPAAAYSAHHLLDARTGRTAGDLASVTVVTESAMVADALATAAFVLGPADGLRLLETNGVEGLLVTPTLERFETAGFRSSLLAGMPSLPARA